jgi:recombinational DNA repair protein RecR
MLRAAAEAELRECSRCGEPTATEICEVCSMLERLGHPK